MQVGEVGDRTSNDDGEPSPPNPLIQLSSAPSKIIFFIKIQYPKRRT